MNGLFVFEVKDAVESSGTPIELFAPPTGLDDIAEEESCGTVDMDFELLQPRMGLRPSCELCVLRIRVDKIYVSEERISPYHPFISHSYI